MRLRLLTLLPVCLGFASSAAQQIESPVSYRVTSELVLLEMIVTDGNGDFVSDLAKGQIKVREDGKEQEIRHFELFRIPAAGSRSDEVRLSPWSAPGPVSQRTFTSPGRGALVVVALDLASIGALPMGRVRVSVSDFIRNHINADDRVMLATIGARLRVEQSATNNHSQILQQLENLQPDSRTAIDETSLGRFMDEIENLFRLVSITANKEVLKDSVSAIGKNLLYSLERRIAASSESLGLLVRSLRPLPGRKHIVLYTAGYPLNAAFLVREIIEQRLSDGQVVNQDLRQHLNAVLGGVRKKGLHEYVQKLIDEANRSQVSFYTVDARGLMALAAGGESTVRGLRHSSNQGGTNEYLNADITAPQDYQKTLAGGTGGLAFINSNDLQKGLERAYRDLHEYYVVGYRPKSKRRRNKFHRIEITVERPDVELRYRKGYFEDDETRAKEREITDALRYPSLFRSYPIAVETAIDGKTLKVYTLVPTDALVFMQKGKRYSGSLEVFGILTDESGKRVGELPAFAKRYSWDIDQSQLEQLRQGDNVVSAATADLPQASGRYRLIVAVRRSLDGRISTHVQEFQP